LSATILRKSCAVVVVVLTERMRSAVRGVGVDGSRGFCGKEKCQTEGGATPQAVHSTSSFSQSM